MRETRRSTLLLLMLTAVGLGGCTAIEDAMATVPFLDFMRESPAFDPYEAPRVPPPNAVPVESPGEKWEPPLEGTDAALRAFGDTATNPLPMTDAVVQRGAEVFTIYCAVCHGIGAQGNGPIVAPGKFPLATNLTLQPTIDRSDGYIYGMIRVGRGLMPSYRRIPPSDRWAVVRYVRYLQQGNPPIDVAVPGLVKPGRDATSGVGAQAPPAQGAGPDTGQGQE